MRQEVERPGGEVVEVVARVVPVPLPVVHPVQGVELARQGALRVGPGRDGKDRLRLLRLDGEAGRLADEGVEGLLAAGRVRDGVAVARGEEDGALAAVAEVDLVRPHDPAEVRQRHPLGDRAHEVLDEGLHRRVERLVDAVEGVQDVVDPEVLDRAGHLLEDRVRAEGRGEVDEERVEVREALLVDVLHLVEELVDEEGRRARVLHLEVERARGGEDDPELAEEDRLDDVRRGERRRRQVRGEDEDPGVRPREEVDDVRVEARLHVEDDVVGRELVDRRREAGLLLRAEVRDLLDEVERRRHEAEARVEAVGVPGRQGAGDALVEPEPLAEEVVEVALDRDADRVADRGGPGVEVDENRRGVAGKRQREVRRDGRLPDAALPGGNGNDPLRHRVRRG